MGKDPRALVVLEAPLGLVLGGGTIAKARRRAEVTAGEVVDVPFVLHHVHLTLQYNDERTDVCYVVYKALPVAGGSACYARSQGRTERKDKRSRWSNILGSNRRLANAKSSMLQESNHAPCTYVRTYLVLFLICTVIGAYFVCCFVQGVLRCAVLCCARGTAADTQRKHTRKYNETQRKKCVIRRTSRKRTNSGRFPTTNIIAGNFRLRRAERGGRIYRGCPPKQATCT